jgi:hypothetical protein
MDAKDKKFYSNPSHSKEFGQYSPPVPSDLLEKLATMKVSTSKFKTDNQHQQPQSNADPPMNQHHTTQEDKGKKVYRQILNNEATNMDLTPELTTKEQSYQAKGRNWKNYQGQALLSRPAHSYENPILELPRAW